MSSGDLATLLRVSQALSSTLDLESVMSAAISGACEVLRLDTGAIYLLEGENLVLGATQPPLPPDFPDEFRTAPRVEHPHIVRCMDSCEPIWIADTTRAELSAAERGVCDSRGLGSVLYVPLCTEGRALGTFIVGAKQAHASYDDVDVALCSTLSHQISLAVVNAQLHASLLEANERLRKAYDDTLVGWATALDMRDHDTRGHADRVEDLTMRLAEVLGVPECEWEHTRRGALLHDIGKMMVPDGVLLKPGPLTEDEWRVMRRHPEAARDLLLAIEHLAPAVVIPYGHHERWDGTGYPQGLAGEDIPLVARIFAVVDVYDALTSDRPYREAWTHEKALAHIESGSGTHFDPDVVIAFMNAIDADKGSQ